MLQSVKELNQAKASFFYGYFLLPNFGFEGTLASLRQAKEWGQVTFFDANSDTEGWGETQRQEIYGLLPHIDYFMPNDEEALQLTETSCVEEAAAVLLDKGARCVVITQGSGGATAFTARERIHQPGFPTKAFDTTGAGDSFNAGFLYARLQGYSLQKSIIFANALASIVVSRKENRYPGLQEIESQIMNLVQ
jgi:sugar/nucleoside kinase (ribokinase family)